MTLITEKKVLTEFLQLYREFPCLWDPANSLYNNREARERAYEVLLDKYRPLQENATIENVRKKIENMRSTYRRERRKVMAFRADGEEYKPSLWYYDLLAFLNNACELKMESITYAPEADENEQYEEYEEGIHRKKSRLSAIYLPEQQHHVELPHQKSDVTNSLNEEQMRLRPENEPEAFGKTIGLQLTELEPMQRYIAEKLIGDVIFYARLEKLKPYATIDLKEDF